MFAKAMQIHDAGPLPKAPKSLAQQLFPSSSPTPVAVGKATAFRGYNASSNVLRQSSSSVLNTCYGVADSLKRTANQRADNGHALGRSENGRGQSSISNKDNKTGVRESSTVGNGVVGILHNAVFFEDDDFVDDADLGLDDDVQVTYPSLSNFDGKHQEAVKGLDHKQSVTYPHLPVFKEEVQLPPQRSPSASAQPVVPSSDPFPWSSSPLRHKIAPHDTHSSLASATKRKHDRALVNEDVPRSRKRSTLPWIDLQLQDEVQMPNGSSSHVLESKRHPMKSRQATGPKSIDTSSTPLPKDKSDSKYPWNQTASAVKEEQKKHRQLANQEKKQLQNTTSEGLPTSGALDADVKKKLIADICLSKEQRSVLDLVLQDKKSVFFTGSAGTGKSVLMRAIIKDLRALYLREPDRVAVTASTGLAACHIGGVTLHSFGGIGLGKEPVAELVKKIKRNQKAKNRWMRTKVLIIDEISMVDGELFDKLEGIARIVRNSGRPFGGIQLVITGDFFQLPPVPDSGRVAKFAFDAATWNTSLEHTIGLTQVFRQKDPNFANMLNEMRLGKLSSKSISTFYKLNRPLDSKDDLEATELFPTRNEVDNANNNRLRLLGGNTVEFAARDGGSIADLGQRAKLLNNCMAPNTLTLKKGAQVMLIKNMDDGLVNGSVGKVVAFMDENMFDYYDKNEEDFQPKETQGLSKGQMDESRSRIRAALNKDNPASTSMKWPLVGFTLGDGTYRELLVQPESWKIELPTGEVQASRSQIPLILAWALSIHKAQGQTLDRVKVDLGKIFEKGQAYVALSRATSQEGLQVVRFDPRKVMAHEKVRIFYDSLYDVSRAQTSIGPASKLRKKADFSEELDDDDEKPLFVQDDDEDEDALQEMYG